MSVLFVENNVDLPASVLLLVAANEPPPASAQQPQITRHIGEYVIKTQGPTLGEGRPFRPIKI